MPYSAGRMVTSKIAYFARNPAGRIYPAYRATSEITGTYARGQCPLVIARNNSN